MNGEFHKESPPRGIPGIHSIRTSQKCMRIGQYKEKRLPHPVHSEVLNYLAITTTSIAEGLIAHNVTVGKYA